MSIYICRVVVATAEGEDEERASETEEEKPILRQEGKKQPERNDATIATMGMHKCPRCVRCNVNNKSIASNSNHSHISNDTKMALLGNSAVATPYCYSTSCGYVEWMLGEMQWLCY